MWCGLKHLIHLSDLTAKDAENARIIKGVCFVVCGVVRVWDHTIMFFVVWSHTHHIHLSDLIAQDAEFTRLKKGVCFVVCGVVSV